MRTFSINKIISLSNKVLVKDIIITKKININENELYLRIEGIRVIDNKKFTILSNERLNASDDYKLQTAIILVEAFESSVARINSKFVNLLKLAEAT